MITKVETKSVAARVRPSRLTDRRRLCAVAVGVVVLASTLALASCGSSTVAPTPPQSLNAGLVAFSQGNYSQARADYEAVLGKDPSNRYGLNKIAWYDLGVLDQRIGRAAAAISEYRQALVLDPKYTNALYNLAILQTLRDPSNAISLYEQALATAPKNPNIQWNLGLLLYKRGHVAKGRALLKSALKISPSLRSKLPKDVTL
jgi:tetratricopeptide (TPR) repeat protein